MPKLKITLLFKILIILVIVWCLINLFFFKYSSKFNGNETNIEGFIIDYHFKDDTLKMSVKAQEKLIVNYQIKSEEEKSKLEETLGFNDYVILKGHLEVPLGNDIPNVFSYQKYLEHQHIYYVFDAQNLTVKANNNFLYKIKNWCYKRINKIEQNEYLKALLLGVKDDIDTELFKTNGISHLFAISGMHISLFILILSKNKYLKKSLIILGFLWFYAFLVGFTPSILRSVLFYTIKKFKLNLTNEQILTIIICLMLFLNPFYLYNIGFIYSFLISFGLLTYHSSKNMLKISLFTFFISLPVTAINNYKVNFLTILFNIIAIPYVSVIMYPLALLTFVLPIFSKVFNCFTALFILLNKLWETIKVGIFIIPKVNFIFWLIYFYLFYKAFYYHQKNYYICLIVLIIIIHFIPYFDNSLKVTYLSVGQGDSTLLVSPHLKKVVLIDTGGSYAKKNYQVANIVTYLNSLGINRIDSLILSHGDYDHAGNTIELISNIKIKEIILNNDEKNDLEKKIIANNIKYYQNINYLTFDKYRLEFLNTKKYDNENDNSNVVYLNYHNYQFLFMGDAGIAKENDLIEKYKLKNITFLKVGHHGSNTSSSKEFITKIKPKYSIISVGINNRYGHPNKETLDNLVNSKIYRTDLNGSIIVNIKNNKLSIDTCF